MKKHYKEKQKKRLSGLPTLLLVMIVWTVWGNLTVGTTYYEIADRAVPATFDGYKIAQISDLHNAVFGKDNAALVYILKSEQPDIIVITGDLVDSSRTDIGAAVAFLEQAVDTAPCYYVTGNHEAYLKGQYDILQEKLTALGVVVLRNQTVSLERGGEIIQLAGIDDPSFFRQDAMFDMMSATVASEIESAGIKAGFCVLLSHRPEAFETYAAKNINLVLSGHAHGGQFRLPLIGGLIAPNQGILPKYDAGIFSADSTSMIVSRGIGNSVFPFRFNNRPEVVIVRLRDE